MLTNSWEKIGIFRWKLTLPQQGRIDVAPFLKDYLEQNKNTFTVTAKLNTKKVSLYTMKKSE